MAKRRFRSRGRFKRIRRRRPTRVRRSKRFIKRVVRSMSEVKYNVATGNHTFDAAVGLLENITPVIEQGVTRRTRIGNRIKYKYFQMRGHMIANATDPTPPFYVTVRHILFVPRNIMPPAPAEVSDSNVLFDSTTAYLSSINSTGVRILYDKTRVLRLIGTTEEGGTFNSYWVFKKKFRISNNINFNSGDQTTINNPSDQVWQAIVTDLETAGECSIFFRHVDRFSFTDI